MATRKKSAKKPPGHLEVGKAAPNQAMMAAPGLADTHMAGQQQELIDHILNGRLTGEIKVTKDRVLKVRAQDDTGATMTLSSYLDPATGYREAGYSALPRKMTPAERKAEVHRLTNDGFTQQEIAGRLGVSQKTISNDTKDR